MKLFLDDIRDVQNVYGDKNTGWVIVRTFEEFKSAITKNYESTGEYPEMISFDHDLGVNETGYDCAKWFVDYYMDNGKLNSRIPDILIHSWNPVGAKNIREYLNNFKHHINKQ